MGLVPLIIRNRPLEGLREHECPVIPSLYAAVSVLLRTGQLQLNPSGVRLLQGFNASMFIIHRTLELPIHLTR